MKATSDIVKLDKDIIPHFLQDFSSSFISVIITLCEHRPDSLFNITNGSVSALFHKLHHVNEQQQVPG